MIAAQALSATYPSTVATIPSTRGAAEAPTYGSEGGDGGAGERRR